MQGLPVLQTDPTVLKSSPQWQEEMHLSRARRIRRACLGTVTLCFEKLGHFLWNFAPERLWGSGYTLFWKVESFFTEFCTGERLLGSGQILRPGIELWRKRGKKVQRGEYQASASYLLKYFHNLFWKSWTWNLGTCCPHYSGVSPLVFDEWCWSSIGD